MTEIIRAYEGAKVSETRKHQYYKVILEEEDTILVNKKTIFEICKECEEEEPLVAILLAYIEYIRKCTSTSGERIRRIQEEVVIDSIINLLFNYSIETLILFFKSFKWYEIKEILEAVAPARKFAMMI